MNTNFACPLFNRSLFDLLLEGYFLKLYFIAYQMIKAICFGKSLYILSMQFM